MRSSKTKENFSLMSHEELIEVVLTNWVRFNRILVKLSRRQVALLLAHELQGEKRPTFLKRLHQRLVRLRSIEESAEIFEKLPDLRPTDIGEAFPWLGRELAQ